MAIGDFFSSMKITGIGNAGFIGSIIWIILGTIVVGICGLSLWFFIKKKKSWNLKIEFKIPRNIRPVIEKDGTITVKGSLNKEWGKGYYNAKEGVVYLKRKGKKPVPMKPFDVKRYLSENGILTVIQVGIEDYRPVLDESYIEVVDDRTGEEAALIKVKVDTSEGKSWRNSYERERKNTYSLSSWLREHGQILAFGIMVMMILVGFGILWTRLPKICG